MRFSVTFPGTYKQAEYLWDMLDYMRHLSHGGVRDEAKDTAFPLLSGMNVYRAFPKMVVGAYRILHDGQHDRIVVRPSHPAAQTDPDGFAFALHAMMHHFERSDVVTFGYSVQGSRPDAPTFSGGAVLADANGWERRSTGSVERKMREEAEARIKAEAFVRDALARGVADDEEDLREVLDVEKKAYAVASAIGETAVTRDATGVVAWLFQHGVKGEELLPEEPAPGM